METRRSVVPLVAVAALLAVAPGCGSASSPTSASSAPGGITALSITGVNHLTAIGQRSALVAVGTRADFTTTIVTSLVTWQSSNPPVVAVSSVGVASAVSEGSAVVTASYLGVIATLTMSVIVEPDCLPYDPDALQLVESPAGVALRASVAGIMANLFTFDSPADAANGLALFQRYSSECFVGRNNTRADHSAYVFPYLSNPTGRPTSIHPEDCEPYSPSTLQASDRGASGWALLADGRQLALLDTSADAGTLLAVARQYSNQCFIGRGNSRGVPQDYVLPYFK